MSERTKHHLPGSLQTLLVGQLSLAVGYLEEYGIEVHELASQIKPVFEHAIVGVFRKAIEEGLVSDGADRAQLALKLRIHSGTRSRWLRGLQEPDWDSMWLGVGAFDCRISLPRGRQAVMAGIIESLEFIRNSVLMKRTKRLSVPEFECLHYIALDPRWWRVQQTPNLRETVRRDIMTGHGAFRNHTECDVDQVIYDWLEPWLFFHAAIPYQWIYNRVPA